MKKFKEYNESQEKVPQPEVSEIMIHLADLSSPANSWKISKQWSQRVCNEFST